MKKKNVSEIESALEQVSNGLSGYEDETEDVKKKMFALFILVFPSLIIAIIPSDILGKTLYPTLIKASIIFYQFVVIKNFIDTHYGK